jgi:hypothetical protein
MSIDDLKKLTEGLKLANVDPQTPADENFQTIRANTRGAIITAHRALAGAGWTIADDKMLDFVSAWLDNLARRAT